MYILKYLTGRDAGTTTKSTKAGGGYHDGSDTAAMTASVMRRLATPLAGSAVASKEMLRQVKALLAGMRRSRATPSDREELAVELVEMALAATARQGGGYGVLKIELPLISLCSDASGLVQALVKRVVAEHGSGAGGALAETVVARMCKLSKVTLVDAQLKPHRIKWPRDVDLAPEELVEAYLGGTPLGALLASPVAVTVSDRTRTEHTIITAGSGVGKSQLIQHLICADLARPKGQEVGLMIIDPHGDVAARVARLKRFANDSRLLIVNAGDLDHPPAINLFDLGGGSLSGLSERGREVATQASVGLCEFVIAGLFNDGDMTTQQRMVFGFLAELMISIPGASVHTLRDCLEDPIPFKPAMVALGGSAARFFTHEFLEKGFAASRKQLLRRLYAVLSNRTFERMFGSSTNRLDVGKALNEGRVIVCDLGAGVLQEQASVLGRYLMACAMKAAQDRSRMPEAERRMSYLYIDEAALVFDSSVERMLAEARKWNIGLVMAHQSLAQMSTGLEAIVMANTSLKLVAGVSAKDARAYAAEMRTSPEQILARTKRVRSTQFAAFVRGITKSAVTWEIPFGTMEAEPQMSEAEFAATLARSRAEMSH